MNDRDELERAKLNLETAQVAWTGLQRFFAQGSVIWVDASLDLIAVAQQIASDDTASIRRLMEGGKVAPVSDAQARRWLAQDAWLWSVVVRPLVLVQETGQPDRQAEDQGHGA